jgi:hypothetical protein
MGFTGKEVAEMVVLPVKPREASVLVFKGW